MGVRKALLQRRRLTQAGKTCRGHLGRQSARQHQQTKTHHEGKAGQRHQRAALLPEHVQRGDARRHAAAIGRIGREVERRNGAVAAGSTSLPRLWFTRRTIRRLFFGLCSSAGPGVCDCLLWCLLAGIFHIGGGVAVL